MNYKNILSIALMSFAGKAFGSCDFASKDGYPCCKGCSVTYEDASGKWGVENNAWCGIDSSCNGQTATCWSTAEGYPCCTPGTAVTLTDSKGKWGIENGSWCGITETKNDNSCWASSLGYGCCNGCEAITVDGSGKWGFENGAWCGIIDSKCKNQPQPTQPSQPSPTQPATPTQPNNPPVNNNDPIGFLSTKGHLIVDEKGRAVKLAGISWFGGETTNLSPHGLWAKPLSHFIKTIKDLGYNHIRYPWTNEMFKEGAKTESVDSVNNPDLADLTPLEVMDAVIEAAGAAGIKVYLDRHRPLAGGQSELWYIDEVPESQWIEDWQFLAKRYKGNPTVIGADLHNEPHGTACWGCGEEVRDWRLAAERCGNAIHEVNPDWLIIVEGNDHYGEEGWQKGESYWWGGMLKGVKENPVRLKVPNKLVYSAHDYDKNVHLQDWFTTSDFPDNMPEIWDDKWGYIVKEDIAPVLIGEFGSVLRDAVDVKWLTNLVTYMHENGVHWTFWCLNPNSGDTEGILGYDWETVNTKKDGILTPDKVPDFYL
ncbi:glycoside hydrolase [Anaeromyces robustus]|jgi:aryl-phospho-beta-D-glucosidase BglC (GH1 family)|uniref:Glycoside hydrolase n=1 Tax=Anaeromyces robustus TaxID=1754192 RepID=A0A1Y1WY12_9FUNG|nr:glycoside hydrolase [Anaeromyces robustus]|eukprot:ORX78403.1 glycoside hydrolase [Anaeromyces robustus]